jgi:Magnesium chelatase, subunit ChlI C-terminal
MRIILSRLSSSVLEIIAEPDAQDGTKLLRGSAETMRLWARGYHRVLRVARTLADLDGAAKIGRLHLAEGLSYRARGGICGGRREMARFRGVSRVSFDITRRFRPAALVNAMLTNAFMTLMPLKLFSLNRPER